MVVACRVPRLSAAFPAHHGCSRLRKGAWFVTSTVVPRTAARMRRVDLRVLVGLALLLAGMLEAIVQQAGSIAGAGDGPRSAGWAGDRRRRGALAELEIAPGREARGRDKSGGAGWGGR
jgi:hypothetical protein